MLYEEVIAVYSEMETKHRNTLHYQNLAFFNVNVGGT
jgi:hypothetical protein